MDLAIVDWFGYNLPPQERMRLIKAAGFSGVMLLWTGAFDRDYKAFPEYARAAGLAVENAHSPYWGYNDLWVAGPKGQKFMKEMLECVQACADYGIPTLVMHPEQKNGTKISRPPLDFTVGIERLKRVVDAAERLHVNIAMENMCRPEYLDRIFSSIDSKRLGFCFDSGHWNVFMPEADLLGLYGDKLMALHLHDNDGKEDWHALPFSGNIDWGGIIAKLKALPYGGAAALEVGIKQLEHIKEPDAFLRLAAERAARINFTDERTPS
ncbi:MAG: sugar phosphate isomerase/epimerase [Oscillospiraceae bacterium]|nr:sugar phosphate isomerase/epimerase [Oscillospiraceae bacterium]